MKKSDFKALKETCFCGSSSYCDTSSRRIVECRPVRTNKCMLFETSQAC